jgi:nucleotide-binding universal stress UspA family protein
MFQRILVAVDGSDTSNAALQEAISLAKDRQAKLRIVHVVDEVNLNVEGVGGMEALWEALRQSGQQILREAETRARNAGIEPEIKLLEIQTLGHRVADTVVQEAEAWLAELIVVGSHGRRGLHRLLLGSVAEGLARLSSKPVLLIRGK